MIECADQKGKSPRKVCNKPISVIFLALATPENWFCLILRYQSVALAVLIFWWRRRYSKPRPKISPRNFLRAYSLYKHSLCQKPNDRRLISVALLCVMSYKAVAHSHLLLLDAPLGTAVLPEGTAALIRQQVKLRFCRLFLNFEAFMVVPRHRSLITTQNPRRNPFVPVFI